MLKPNVTDGVNSLIFFASVNDTRVSKVVVAVIKRNLQLQIMFNFYYFHENDHDVENDYDTCDYWRTIAYECQYQVKDQCEVVSRLQSELKLTEKRLSDVEKVNKVCRRVDVLPLISTPPPLNFFFFHSIFI